MSMYNYIVANSEVTGLLFLLTSIIFLYHTTWRRRGAPVPPGPKGLPLLGNALDWPRFTPWLKFTEWKEVFGDIVSLNILGQPVIVLNSYQGCRDLLDRRNFQGRPSLPMGETMKLQLTIPLSQPDARWKDMRRLVSSAMVSSSITRSEPNQLLMIRSFTLALIKEPENWRDNLRFLVSRHMIQTNYGINTETPSHSYIKLMAQVHDSIDEALTPGSYLIDVFPSLKYLPIYPSKAHGTRTRKLVADMIHLPYQDVRDSVEAGTAQPSLLKSILEQESNLDEHAHSHKYAVGSLYGAGVETNISTLETFFMLMTIYPDIQRQAQEELDRVVGRDRLPTFSDRKDLVYIEALLMECLRWHPPLPMGVAHSVKEESIYNDYLIPANSVILPNMWAISRDPSIYQDPFTFEPKRFLKGLGHTPELDVAKWCFGFGLRRCLGIQYATSLLFMTIATTAWGFDIYPGEGPDGKPVDVKDTFSGVTIAHPESFPCRVVSRGADFAKRLEESL